jgi:hypothetical protein
MTKPSSSDQGSQTPTNANEGEGNRTAARNYDAGVAKTVASGKVDEKAREAAEALDGDEGEELRRAEERGKQPPNKKHQ